MPAVYPSLGIVGVSMWVYVAAMSLNAADYRPRDAEHAVLYRAIDEHLEASSIWQPVTPTGHPCRSSWNRSSGIASRAAIDA